MVLMIDVPKGNSASSEESITILFTHDLHDNFLPFEVRRERGNSLQLVAMLDYIARLKNKEKKTLMRF